MKKFLILILTVIPFCAMAQDVIWFSPDRKIEGKVLEVSASAVKYKKESNLNGPVYVESKSEIVAIVYSNGDKDIWSNRVKDVSKDRLVLIQAEDTAKAKAEAVAKNAFSANQGNPFGNPNSSNLSGLGKCHQGSGWRLSGRSITGSLPKPVSSNNVTGTVVVTIEVDASGKVISAKAGAKGTNTYDTELWNAAVTAAKKTRFNGISGSTVQTGTITYNFVN